MSLYISLLSQYTIVAAEDKSLFLVPYSSSVDHIDSMMKCTFI